MPYVSVHMLYILLSDVVYKGICLGGTAAQLTQLLLPHEIPQIIANVAIQRL